MTTAATRSIPRVLSPGFVLLGNGRVGVASVFRLAEHKGATIETKGSRYVVRFRGSASLTWIAWYSPRITENGWEPYDQPHLCAYLPVAYAALQKLGTADGGLLLRQKGTERVGKIAVRNDVVVEVAPSAATMAERARAIFEHFGAVMPDEVPEFPVVEQAQASAARYAV